MEANKAHMNLVPKRKCGTCNACCDVPAIVDNGLVKRPNELCKHNVKRRCSIFPNWPKVCDEFYCAWRRLESLNDEWRPDRIGVMIDYTYENFPPPFQEKTGLRFVVLDKNKLKINYKLADFIAKQIKLGFPCILSYSVDKGQAPNTAVLNFILKDVVDFGKKKDINAAIWKVVTTLENMPKQQSKIENGKLVFN